MDLRNAPFDIESRLVRKWYAVTDARPSSAPFVSGDSFRAIADHVFEPGMDFRPYAVGAGDVVFVKSSELDKFCLEVLSHLKKRFVLITHNGDLNVDSRFQELASNPTVIRWFAQNALIRHPKVTAIPIGLENQRLYCNGIVKDFNRLQKRSVAKSKRILSAFSVQTNRSERSHAQKVFRRSRLVDEIPRRNSRAYRKVLIRYAFVASPPGNGIDCHRTWEALYLGVVPIVRKSPFFESFPGLPVAAIDAWEEVLDWTEDDLVERFESVSKDISQSPYLRFSYWEGLIKSAQASLQSLQVGVS